MAAYLIDAVIFGVVCGMLIVIGVLVTGLGSVFEAMVRNRRNPIDPDASGLLLFGFISIFVAAGIIGGWLYHALCESSEWQGTPGKKALGLIVTDLAGQRISFGRATGRYFAKIITGMVPLGIGYILAGITEKKQALHDMIASCLVLRRV